MLLSQDQVAQYNRDGYLLMPYFFSIAEATRLYNIAIEDSAMQHNAIDLNDQEGRKTRLSLWFTPGDDSFGYLTRSEKMIGAVQQLLANDSPVCHFHSKLMQKEPRVGGAWEWHQDYGYWYNNGCLCPDLASCLIAVI